MTHRLRPDLLVAAFTLLGGAVAIGMTTPAPLWLVPALLLVPDLSFLAAIGAPAPELPGAMPRRAVRPYNATHHPIGPVVTLLVGAVVVSWTVALVGVVWAAHITWDRAVGYDLREPDGTIRVRTHARRHRGTTRPTAAMVAPPRATPSLTTPSLTTPSLTTPSLTTPSRVTP